MKRYSDLTKKDWDRTSETPIYEFLNVCSFSLEYDKAQEKELQKYRRTH